MKNSRYTWFDEEANVIVNLKGFLPAVDSRISCQELGQRLLVCRRLEKKREITDDVDDDGDVLRIRYPMTLRYFFML